MLITQKSRPFAGPMVWRAKFQGLILLWKHHTFEIATYENTATCETLFGIIKELGQRWDVHRPRLNKAFLNMEADRRPACGGKLLVCWLVSFICIQKIQTKLSSDLQCMALGTQHTSNQSFTYIILCRCDMPRHDCEATWHKQRDPPLL